MKESEFAQRAMAEKERLYRTALIYLGGEAAALDAVDEAVYRGLLAFKIARCFGQSIEEIFLYEEDAQ